MSLEAIEKVTLVEQQSQERKAAAAVYAYGREDQPSHSGRAD